MVPHQRRGEVGGRPPQLAVAGLEPLARVDDPVAVDEPRRVDVVPEGGNAAAAALRHRLHEHVLADRLLVRPPDPAAIEDPQDGDVGQPVPDADVREPSLVLEGCRPVEVDAGVQVAEHPRLEVTAG